MNYNDLKKGSIYSDIIDKNLPLLFTGVIKERVQFNSSAFIAEFKPVKTELNKNWYNSQRIIHRAFDPENRNITIKTDL